MSSVAFVNLFTSSRLRPSSVSYPVQPHFLVMGKYAMLLQTQDAVIYLSDKTIHAVNTPNHA